MRGIRKHIRTMMIILMILLLPLVHVQSLAVNAVFPDLSSRHWAYNTILWAHDKGIIKGLGNGHAAPDRLVTQAEFTAMITRAFVTGSEYEKDYDQIQLPADADWDLRDFTFALHMNWAVTQDKRARVITRGDVAQIVTSIMGLTCTENESIQYLLDHGLSTGKTAPTISGYKAGDSLSRAEAVQFIYNVYHQGIEIARRAEEAVKPCFAEPKQREGIEIGGFMIGDPEAEVYDQLGELSLKVTSRYGFTWHIYHQDYKDYVQIGIKDRRIVSLQTVTDNWQTSEGIGPGSTYDDVIRTYGEPLKYKMIGNTRYLLDDTDRQFSFHEQDGYYVTFYYDLHEKERVSAVQLIDKDVEHKLTDYYAEPDDELADSFERQVFELANATRVAVGLEPFEWDDRASVSARKHSRNMAENNFFSHVDELDQSPSDRMRSEGILFTRTAENIAAGQKDPLQVHMAWLNSATGHREVLLGPYERLGVGVAFSTDGKPYYTQNFYTPRKLLAIKDRYVFERIDMF